MTRREGGDVPTGGAGRAPGLHQPEPPAGRAVSPLIAAIIGQPGRCMPASVNEPLDARKLGPGRQLSSTQPYKVNNATIQNEWMPPAGSSGCVCTLPNDNRNGQ